MPYSVFKINGNKRFRKFILQGTIRNLWLRRDDNDKIFVVVGSCYMCYYTFQVLVMGIKLEKSGVWGNDVKDVFIKNNDKIIKIIYGGSGDLFIKALASRETDSFIFEVHEEDPFFKLFDALFCDIVNCNVFEENPSLNKILKNSSVYNKIYDGKQIGLYSDSSCDEDANKLVIFKNNDSIFL